MTEMVRDENRQLLQDRDIVENENQTLCNDSIQTHASQRDLKEDDKTWMDRDVITREGESKDIRNTVLYSKQTTIEVDNLLQSCKLWQDTLASWSHELARKVKQRELYEVKDVVKNLVTKVEIKTLQDQVKTDQMELQWAFWLQEDAVNGLKEIYKDTKDTDVFEAMEKQLMNDRVVELETQLGQKRALEKEKEMELSSLRADQEQLMQSGRAELHKEFETLVAVKEAMDAELKQLKEKVKEQAQMLACVDEERANLQLHNQKLVEETRQPREDKETRELKAMQQCVKQEKEIKKLHDMLQVGKNREAETTAALARAEQMMKQRKEELKILYTKFSSAMDSVSEKTMRLEELEQELKDLQGNRNRNEQLEKQVAQLQQEKAELSAARHCEKDDMSEELVIVRKQLMESKELASQQKELTSKLQCEITVLKSQNEALMKQQVKQEHQSVGQPSKESDSRNIDIDSDLVVHVAEKEALQMFVQRYYPVAEEKCSRLFEKVSKLELQFKQTQDQTKEACSLLRMCTQVDACDESVRASLLDVMATLEGLT
ncbi:unnamed protein product [Peronospora effusa]|uniref:Uncharacterized protein n=1 Tax=Peronospora effusa TaxID=542832 RepID=A0A3M6VS91_9STRA|nr:hypothetical protein DD238_001728 [Peronospora effusa]CAI5703652.1 unnamed protein product [Peronospora effusa]